MDPNVNPVAAKGTGIYINSSLAKVEALKAGYDEAILLNTAGLRRRVHRRERLHREATACSSRRRSSSGALAGITRDSVMTIARDLGYEVREEQLLRSDLYLADEAFLTGTAAEVVPIRSVDDREIGDPGEITRKLQETYFAAVRGEVERYKDWLEHVLTTTAVRDPSWPARVEIYDTTLRDGSQLEGISLTVDDKLRIAEQLDWLGVDFIEAGWPGANPKDDEFFRARAAGARARHEHAGRVRLDAPGEGQGRLRRHAAPPARRRHVDGVHRRQVVGLPRARGAQTTLDEGVAMVADSVEFLRADGRDVFFDAEHFFDGYRRNPEFSLRVLEGAARGGRDPARALRHQRRHAARTRSSASSREVVDYFGGDVGVAVHLHDDAGTGVANALAGVRGGAIQVQGTINGYGERTGNCNLTTIIPNLTLKMGIETIPRDRLERLTPVAHHVAELVNMALNPQAAYVGVVGVRAQGRAARERDRQAARRLRARPARLGRQRHPLRGVGARGQEHAACSRPRSSGSTLDGPQLNDLVDTLKRMEHEGYHFEVADASLELLMRRATGWEQPWFEVESFRVITDDDDPSSTPPGGVTTEATIKVHVGGERLIATAEGNGPVNALDTALRSALGDRYPALDARAPHRLQGAGARHRQGHRRGHPGAGRLHQRRPHVDHDRREREHHRGVVAGALRLAGLRLAPRQPTAGQ